MSKVKYLHIYSISKYWRTCTVYYARASNQQLIGRSTVTPNKGVKLAERRTLIIDWLAKDYGIKVSGDKL